MIPKALKCPECGSPLKGLPSLCAFCGNYIYDSDAQQRRQLNGMFDPRANMSTASYSYGTLSLAEYGRRMGERAGETIDKIILDSLE